MVFLLNVNDFQVSKRNLNIYLYGNRRRVTWGQVFIKSVPKYLVAIIPNADTFEKEYCNCDSKIVNY